jgi:hypothetical protein
MTAAVRQVLGKLARLRCSLLEAVPILDVGSCQGSLSATGEIIPENQECLGSNHSYWKWHIPVEKGGSPQPAILE